MREYEASDSLMECLNFGVLPLKIVTGILIKLELIGL